MISRKGIQTFIIYLGLFSFAFAALYVIIYFPIVPTTLDSRSPLLSVIVELKDIVSRQSDELKELKLQIEILQDTLDIYKQDLFNLKKKHSKDPTTVHKDLKRYALNPEFEGEPPETTTVSKMTNQRDFNSDWFFEASKKLRFSYTVKVRKHWELAYIYTNFRELITPTNKGLVFGECNTALTPYFISQGVHVTCVENTDSDSIQSEEDIKRKLLSWKPSWIQIDNKIADIGNDDKFLSYIDYRTKIFATDIIGGLDKLLYQNQYDFVWSTGTVETLSSVDDGIAFIKNSVSAVKPGGKIVHMVNLIVDRDSGDTDDSQPILWKVDDLKKARKLLCDAGYNVKKLELGIGNGFYDVHPDKPPYHLDSHHIKLLLKNHIVTSFAILIEVPKKSQVPYPCE